MSKAADDVSHSSPECDNNLEQQQKKKNQLNSGKQQVDTDTKKPPFKHGDQGILASRPDFAHSQNHTCNTMNKHLVNNTILVDFLKLKAELSL
ncbi:hypothetical protein GQ457_16G009950 [Hibiscus cannabinus]